MMLFNTKFSLITASSTYLLAGEAHLRSTNFMVCKYPPSRTSTTMLHHLSSCSRQCFSTYVCSHVIPWYADTHTACPSDKSRPLAQLCCELCIQYGELQSSQPSHSFLKTQQKISYSSNLAQQEDRAHTICVQCWHCDVQTFLLLFLLQLAALYREHAIGKE